MTDSQAAFITLEVVQEWMSFGPPLKGKPTPEQLEAAKATKAKRKDYIKKLADNISDADAKEWTEKKIEKELDRLAVQAEATAALRPEYLDGPSGTRDFYPAEMAVRNWLFGHMRDTAKLFGFQEYDCPVLENVQLYERKAGEEIVDQMYAFTDKEGKRVTLRPEMTPSLARMVLNKTNLQTGEYTFEGGLPLKWFSIPQCWRFETTQRGRKREHYQWNMDVVGVEHVHAEAELLAAACEFFRRVGIGSDVVGIKVNSRAVLEALLAQHGIKKGGGEEDIFAKACVIIDKLDKIGGEAVTELLAEIGVNADSAAAILKALCAESIEALSEILGEEGANSPAIQEVKRLFEVAKEYGYSDYIIFDASVVRGLAYYTGIVWEAFDRRGELRAIMGGGRYDRLLELYGGEKCQIPCVGFGFGDCVIMELLSDLKLVPDMNQGADYVVCSFSPELYGKAASISHGLRRLGCSVDLMPTPRKKVKNSFAHADRTGARRMVFVAPDEVDKGLVRIKDLRLKDAKGEAVQIDCPLDALDTIEDLIAKAAQAS